MVADSSHDRHYRTPVTDGAVLAVPAWSEVPTLVERNREGIRQNAGHRLWERPPSAQHAQVECQTCRERGLPADAGVSGSWGSFRDNARREVLAAAIAYTSSLRNEVVELNIDEAVRSSWFLTGHQPGFSHGGVWVKHAAASQLAQQTGGIGLNLVVDNDLAGSAQVKLPVGPVEAPFVRTIGFDVPAPPQPWEERDCLDPNTFRTFGTELSQLIEREWGFKPALASCWSDAVNHLSQSTKLSDCLTAMRHLQEQRCGVNNLEVPLSQLCETTSFQQFAAILIADASRFFGIYNSAVHRYRHENSVRSTSHPVPVLNSRGDWVESPFWIWQTGAKERQRLWVCQRENEIVLAANQKPLLTLPLDDSQQNHPSAIATALKDLSNQGWRIRSRALTTTLFARLALADLFIHGIGGAKYDEMTDWIAQEFFGVQLPEYLTLTATKRLPIAATVSTKNDNLAEKERHLQRRLRDLQYNVDRVLDSPVAHELGEQKRLQLMRREEVTGDLPRHERQRRYLNNRAVHQQVVAINQKLVSMPENAIVQTREELSQVRRQQAASRVLENREYGWPLFPPTLLKELVQQLESVPIHRREEPALQ